MKILNKVYKDENFIDNLSSLFKTPFRKDWVGRIYAIFNPHIQEGIFDQNNQMTLYFENIRVRLGDISNIDDKIIRLKAILPELEGQKGILRMENYVDGMKNITFNTDS